MLKKEGPSTEGTPALDVHNYSNKRGKHRKATKPSAQNNIGVNFLEFLNINQST